MKTLLLPQPRALWLLPLLPLLYMAMLALLVRIPLLPGLSGLNSFCYLGAIALIGGPYIGRWLVPFIGLAGLACLVMAHRERDALLKKAGWSFLLLCATSTICVFWVIRFGFLPGD